MAPPHCALCRAQASPPPVAGPAPPARKRSLLRDRAAAANAVTAVVVVAGIVAALAASTLFVMWADGLRDTGSDATNGATRHATVPSGSMANVSISAWTTT